MKMKTAGERIDDMITISLNNIKGLKQICCTDNYARNILLKNNEKNDIGTKFENQNYMDNALKHISLECNHAPNGRCEIFSVNSDLL